MFHFHNELLNPENVSIGIRTTIHSDASLNVGDRFTYNIGRDKEHTITEIIERRKEKDNYSKGILFTLLLINLTGTDSNYGMPQTTV